MKTGFLFRASFCVALLAWMLLLADYADARGRGRVGGGGRGAAAGAGVGGAGRAGATAPGSAGGFSRSGPASSGSFASSGGSRLINTNVVNANMADTTILRGGGDPVAAVPGTVATAGAVAAGTAAVARARTTAVAALPCSADPVLVNGITYYKCDSTWFTRSYIDGDVAYVVTNPPG